MYFSGTKNDLLRDAYRHQPTATIASNLSSNAGNSSGKATGAEDNMSIIGGLVFFYTFVAFLALQSNILIIIIIIQRYVKRSTVNTFLLSLAVSDLLMVVLSLLDFVSFLSESGWLFGVELCKLQSFILEISFTASTLTLVAVSIERYLLICYPYMERRSIKVIYRILCLVWILSCLICTPLIDGYTVREYDGINKCFFDNWSKKNELIFYAVYSFVTYLIPLLAMAFAHWRIGLSVKVSNGRRASAQSTLIKEKKSNVCYTIREEEPSSSSSTEKTDETDLSCGETQSKGFSKAFLNSINGLSKRSRVSTANNRDMLRREKHLKAIRLLFVVTVTFFVLWTPFILMRLVREAGAHIHEYLYKFSEILIFSSTAVNGFIYAFINRSFRNAFKALLCCKSRREFISKDSAPSVSFSEDNRLTNKRNISSRGSSVNNELKNGLMPNAKVATLNLDDSGKQDV